MVCQTDKGGVVGLLRSEEQGVQAAFSGAEARGDGGEEHGGEWASRGETPMRGAIRARVAERSEEAARSRAFALR